MLGTLGILTLVCVVANVRLVGRVLREPPASTSGAADTAAAAPPTANRCAELVGGSGRGAAADNADAIDWADAGRRLGLDAATARLCAEPGPVRASVDAAAKALLLHWPTGSGRRGEDLGALCYRESVRQRRPVALPARGLSFGWPAHITSSDLRVAAADLTPPSQPMFCGGYARWPGRAQLLSALQSPVRPSNAAPPAHPAEPGPQFVTATVLADPLAQAYSHRQKSNAAPLSWWRPLAEEAHPPHWLDNMAFDLGLDQALSQEVSQRTWTRADLQAPWTLAPGPGELSDKLQAAAPHLLRRVERDFDLVLLAEYPEASAVLMQQALGWSAEQVVALTRHTWHRPDKPDYSKTSGSPHYPPPTLDRLLYVHFNATFWQRLRAIDDAAEKMARIRALRQTWEKRCAALPLVADELRSDALLALERNGAGDSAAAFCHLSALSTLGLVAHLRRVRFQTPDLAHANPDRVQADGPVLAPGAPDGGRCQVAAPSHRRRFVWIKTHKTGSSTVTNILHRFVWEHNVSAALPHDDMFYGWPDPQDLPATFTRGKEPLVFEALCSAHARYSPARMDRLVPGADYITLLRHPVSHFLSSWAYWRVTEKTKPPYPNLSAEDFLRDPEKHLAAVPPPQVRLIHNSMAHDLGLPTNPDPRDVENLLVHVQRRFRVVLILEHLDESLIVLKHRMGWTLGDVLYFRLKVSKKAKPRVADHLAEAVLRFNAADLALYRHFNATLWTAIAEIPDFERELGALRAANEALSSACQGLAGQDDMVLRRRLTDDLAREAVREGDAGGLPHCALALMDSIGYSRALKVRAGLEHSECMVPHQTAHVLLAAPPVVPGAPVHPGEDVLRSIFHRYGLRRNLDFLLPASDRALLGGAWEEDAGMAAWEGRERKGGDGEPVHGGHARHPHMAVSWPLAPVDAGLLKSQRMPRTDAKIIHLVQDPVRVFLRQFFALDLPQRLWLEQVRSGRRTGQGAASGDAGLTPARFLAAPERHRHLLSAGEWDLLFSPLVSSMGLELGNASSAHDVFVTIANQALYIDPVLPAEHMSEALPVLRRLLCWDEEDFAVSRDRMFWTGGGAERGLSAAEQAYRVFEQRHLTPTLRKRFEEWSVADAAAYRVFNMTFWGIVDKSSRLEEEQRRLEVWGDRLDSQCRGVEERTGRGGENVLREAGGGVGAMTSSPALVDLRCRILAMDSVEFARAARQQQGWRGHVCAATRPAARATVAVDVWSAAGKALASVFLAFAWREQMKVVVDNKGLPPGEGVGSLFPHAVNFERLLRVVEMDDGGAGAGAGPGDGGHVNDNELRFVAWEDPVCRFAREWQRLGGGWVGQEGGIVGRNGVTVTLADLAEGDGGGALARLTPAAQVALSNPQARRFAIMMDKTVRGGASAVSAEETIAVLERLFSAVLVGSLLESVAHVAHITCWDLGGVWRTGNHEEGDCGGMHMTAEQRKQLEGVVERVSAADLTVHKHFAKVQADRAEATAFFSDHVEQLAAREDKTESMCAALDKGGDSSLRGAGAAAASRPAPSRDERRKLLLAQPAGDRRSLEQGCHARMLDYAGLRRLTLASMGRDVDECQQPWEAGHDRPEALVFAGQGVGRMDLGWSPLEVLTVIGSDRRRPMAVVLASPVELFLQAWEMLGMQGRMETRMGGQGREEAVQAFAEMDAEARTAMLNRTELALLINPQARVLASTAEPEAAIGSRFANDVIVSGRVMPMLVDMWPESVILLRRRTCMDAETVARAVKAVGAGAGVKTSPALATAVKKLCPVDWLLHTIARSHLQRVMQQGVGFVQEVSSLRKRIV